MWWRRQTQFCFESAPILGWIGGLYARGGLRKSAEWLGRYGPQPQRSASGAGAQNP